MRNASWPMSSACIDALQSTQSLCCLHKQKANRNLHGICVNLETMASSQELDKTLKGDEFPNFFLNTLHVIMCLCNSETRVESDRCGS